MGCLRLYFETAHFDLQLFISFLISTPVWIRTWSNWSNWIISPNFEYKTYKTWQFLLRNIHSPSNWQVSQPLQQLHYPTNCGWNSANPWVTSDIETRRGEGGWGYHESLQMQVCRFFRVVEREMHLNHDGFKIKDWLESNQHLVAMIWF